MKKLNTFGENNDAAKKSCLPRLDGNKYFENLMLIV